MNDPSESVVERSFRLKRAHREANRLLVGAGILLAGVGVPPHAPQMKALAAALRAVNRAGGIEGTTPRSPAEREISRGKLPSENRRIRRAAL